MVFLPAVRWNRVDGVCRGERRGACVGGWKDGKEMEVEREREGASSWPFAEESLVLFGMRGWAGAAS